MTRYPKNIPLYYNNTVPYQHPNKHIRYNRCDNAENGVTRLASVKCPTGLAFDVERQTCDWRTNVKNCKQVESKLTLPLPDTHTPHTHTHLTYTQPLKHDNQRGCTHPEAESKPGPLQILSNYPTTNYTDIVCIITTFFFVNNCSREIIGEIRASSFAFGGFCSMVVPNVVCMRNWCVSRPGVRSGIVSLTSICPPPPPPYSSLFAYQCVTFT